MVICGWVLRNYDQLLFCCSLDTITEAETRSSSPCSSPDFLPETKKMKLKVSDPRCNIFCFSPHLVTSSPPHLVTSSLPHLLTFSTLSLQASTLHVLLVSLPPPLLLTSLSHCLLTSSHCQLLAMSPSHHFTSLPPCLPASLHHLAYLCPPLLPSFSPLPPSSTTRRKSSSASMGTNMVMFTR